MKPSEKGRKRLRCSLTDHRNGTFRPILASLHRLHATLKALLVPLFGQFQETV
jgi:hypothetical protein